MISKQRIVTLACVGGLSGLLAHYVFEGQFDSDMGLFLLLPGAVFGVFLTGLALSEKRGWLRGVVWFVASTFSFYAAWWAGYWLHDVLVQGNLLDNVLVFGIGGLVGGVVLLLAAWATREPVSLRFALYWTLVLTAIPAVFMGTMFLLEQSNFVFASLMVLWQTCAFVMIDALFRGGGLKDVLATFLRPRATEQP